MIELSTGTSITGCDSCVVTFLTSVAGVLSICDESVEVTVSVSPVAISDDLISSIGVSVAFTASSTDLFVSVFWSIVFRIWLLLSSLTFNSDNFYEKRTK